MWRVDMNAKAEAEVPPKTDPPRCLARSVADALAENPALEAVTINRARHTISLATIGQADLPKLTARINDTVQRAGETAEQARCTLLDGQEDCHTCIYPLSEIERQ